jgi:hypothetical protein
MCFVDCRWWMWLMIPETLLGIYWRVDVGVERICLTDRMPWMVLFGWVNWDSGLDKPGMNNKL